MTSQVVIVTGASSGIGYQVALELCGRGYDVILACRNEEKANAAVAKIKENHPNALATYIHIDLASLESVRRFVEEFHATGRQAEVIINNAGIRLSNKERQPTYTVDNLELTMSTNYVGHFLLANLLLEDLKKTAAAGRSARVINVTSAHHDISNHGPMSGIEPLDLDNLFLLQPGTYNSQQAYKNSKLANVMFTFELARRLDGTGVAVNAVAPGFTPSTELLRHAGDVQRFFQKVIMDGPLRFAGLTRSMRDSASCVFELAILDLFKGVTGRYFGCKVEISPAEESLDVLKQSRLWDLTAGYCHLEGYPPLNNSPLLNNRRRSAGPKLTNVHESTPKRKGKTTSEPEKNLKSSPEGDKKKEKGSPDSDDKKTRRGFFPWSRSKKEEPSNLVELKVEGKREKVETMVSDEGTTAAGLHDSIRAIDLSTDLEEKLGKSDEEKVEEEKVEEKLGKSDEEKVEEEKVEEKLGKSDEKNVEEGEVEEKLGKSDEEKVEQGEVEKKLCKSDEEKVEQGEENVVQIEQRDDEKEEKKQMEENVSKFEEKTVEIEKKTDVNQEEVEGRRSGETGEVLNRDDPIEEASDERAVEEKADHPPEKIDEKMEEKVKENVEKEEKVDEKVDDKDHEKVDTIGEKSDHQVDNGGNKEIGAKSDKSLEERVNGAGPEVESEAKAE